jgi:hypothetical protein
MKTRKKRLAVTVERRNALYNKTILHNRELAEKNTELSHIIDYWKTKYNTLNRYIHRKRWWQFWKQFTQVSWLLNETETELFNNIEPEMCTITYFYQIPIWKSIKRLYL